MIWFWLFRTLWAWVVIAGNYVKYIVVMNSKISFRVREAKKI